MIVQCPSCSTRYRHQPASGLSASLAGCSKCEATFPLTPALRQYLLRPPIAIPGGAVQHAPLSAADPGRLDPIRIPVAATPLVEPPAAPPAAPSVEPTPAVAVPWPDYVHVEAAPPAMEAAPAEPAPLPAIGLPEPDETLAAAPEAQPAVEAVLRPRRKRATEIAATCIPAAVGGSLAYTVASLTGRDPLTWAVLGGALGLLGGWLCLSWIVRQD